MKGYEGDSCSECGKFTLVRNGTCLECDTCSATSGCSRGCVPADSFALPKL